MFRRLNCPNEYVNRDGQQVKCNHVLIVLPDWILTNLKLMEGDEEGIIKIHCSGCKGSKFGEIKYVGGELTYEALLFKPDLGVATKFQNELKCTEALLVEDLNAKEN